MNNQSSGKPSSARPLLHGVDWAVQAGVTDEVMSGIRQRLRRRRRQRLTWSAALGTAVIAAGVWFSVTPKPDASERMLASSAIVASPTRQVLPDGSVVEL